MGLESHIDHILNEAIQLELDEKLNTGENLNLVNIEWRWHDGLVCSKEDAEKIIKVLEDAGGEIGPGRFNEITGKIVFGTHSYFFTGRNYAAYCAAFKNAESYNEVHCPVCSGVGLDSCPACEGRGYNIVTFKNGRRVK